MRKLVRFALTLVTATVAVLAAACATVGGAARPAEEVVLERAQARWNALIKREWSVAYGFNTPAYRAVVSLDQYSSRITVPVRWEDAKTQSVQCDEKRCAVRVEVFFRVMLPSHRGARSSTYIDESWVLEDGHWYYVDKP